MTVDSRYEPQRKARDNEVEYSFEIESIGDEAMRVYIIKDGNRYLLNIGYAD